MSKISIGKVYFDNLSIDDTRAALQNHINNHAAGVMVRADLNAASLIASDSDETIREFINSSQLVNIDGMGVIMTCKILRIASPQRYTGVDFMIDSFKFCNDNKLRVFFLGSKDEILDLVCSKIKIEYPGIQVCGAKHGYFDIDSCTEVIKSISESKPDFLFIGITSPKKEYFTIKYKQNLGAKIIAPVGGAFDVYSGVVKRAPKYLQKFGFEWLFRVIQEPRRLFYRYLKVNFLLSIFIIKELIRRVWF